MLERNATVLVALFLTNGNVVSNKFVGVVSTAVRGELATVINVLSVFKVINHSIVAIFCRNCVNVGRKSSVAVLEFLSARNENNAFEVNSP